MEECQQQLAESKVVRQAGETELNTQRVTVQNHDFSCSAIKQPKDHIKQRKLVAESRFQREIPKHREEISVSRQDQELIYVEGYHSAKALLDKLPGPIGTNALLSRKLRRPLRSSSAKAPEQQPDANERHEAGVSKHRETGEASKGSKL